MTNGMHRIGYVYWKNGMVEEADYYFDKQVEYGIREIDLIAFMHYVIIRIMILKVYMHS
jgi:pentatricopeptide repeat protein